MAADKNRENRPITHERFGLLDLFAITVALIVFLIPLLTFSRIPTQDGPLHVDTAAVMLRSLRDGSDFLNKFFYIRWAFETNTLGHYILILCLRLTSTPEHAEKLFQYLYLTIFAGGLAYFLTVIRPGAWRLTPLGLPFAYSYIFHLGFYNCSLSMCGFFWCWGAFIRCRRKLNVWNLLALILASLLTWLAHPIGMVGFACGAIFWMGLEILLLLLVRSSAAQAESKLHQLKLKLMLPTFVIVAAPFAAEFLFVSGKGGAAQYKFKSWAELSELLFKLSTMNSFGVPRFDSAMNNAVIAFSVIFVAAAVFAIKRREKSPYGLFSAAMVLFYLAVFFLAPTDAAGSGYINERVMPFIFYFVFALLAAVVSSRAAQRVALILGIAALADLHSLNWPTYARAEKIEQDYLFAVNKLEPNSIVYTMQLASGGYDGQVYASMRVDFMVHLAGFYTAAADGIYLNNIIARWNEGRQTSFKPEIMKGMDALPPAFGGYPVEVDFEKFNASVGRPIDYVIIYGAFKDEKSMARYYENLLRDTFDCAMVSPLNLVKVCKHRAT